MKKLSYVFFISIFICLNIEAQCTYMAYEGFDYSLNSALSGQQGGNGWSEAWSVQNLDAIVPGYQTSSTNSSLTYGALQNTGYHMSGGRTYLTAGRALNVDYDGPFADYIMQYYNGIGSQTGDTLFYSVVMNKYQASEELFLNFHNGGGGWCYSCGNQLIGIGFYGASSTVLGQERWSLNVNGTIHNTNVALTLNQNYLLVVRVIFNNSSTQIDLYVNPSSLGTSGIPATSSVSVTENANFGLTQVATYLGGQAGNGAIDEIRFAGSYECVTPDNTVSINYAPTAAFTYTPTTGMAPLTVSVDGSISADAEGAIVTYEWDFGDGSPLTTGITTSHVFNNIGIVPITLTVTDNSGQQHSYANNVSVLDANNTFPCQTTVSSISRPTCTNTNGSIEVTVNNASFELKNSNNVTMPVTNASTFNNLPHDEYTLYVEGTSSVCKDTMHLYMQTDSSQCTGWTPSACNMAIGSNMSSLADWGVERPMKNRFKHVRNILIPYTDDCFCWSTDNIGEISFDVNGYPTHIPQVTSVGNTKVRFIISADGGNLQPDSTYVLLFDGAGAVELAGTATIISQSSNRLEFIPLGSDNYVLNILSSTLGNNIRNMRLLRVQDEFDDLTAEPFYDVFLEKIAPFEVLRFMDWGLTNNNPISTWNDRATQSYFTYAHEVGVPYEIMIDLANLTHKDMWICIPHAADDNFITELATLVRDNLDDGLIIYLEYSNEVWNWIFDQAHYNYENKPANLDYGRAMAEKGKHVFQIWHSVFGNDKCKVKRVLGLQAGNNYLNELILSQLKEDEWDYGSPTAYFGLDHSAGANPVLGASSTYQDVMTNAVNNWNSFKPLVKQDYDNIHLYGKRIINYEGGQHFVGNSFGIPYDYQNAMWDAQNSIEMYNLYDNVLDTIRSWGSEMFANFSLATVQESVYGSWGVLPAIDVAPPYSTTALKYQALLDNTRDSICINRLQWNGQESQWWDNLCNWTPAKIPTSSSDVWIESGTPHDPTVNVDAFANSVQLSLGVYLQILSPFNLYVE